MALWSAEADEANSLFLLPVSRSGVRGGSETVVRSVRLRELRDEQRTESPWPQLRYRPLRSALGSASERVAVVAKQGHGHRCGDEAAAAPQAMPPVTILAELHNARVETTWISRNRVVRCEEHCTLVHEGGALGRFADRADDSFNDRAGLRYEVLIANEKRLAQRLPEPDYVGHRVDAKPSYRGVERAMLRHISRRFGIELLLLA